MPLPYEKQEINLPNLISPDFEKYRASPKERDKVSKIEAQKELLQQLKAKNAQRIKEKEKQIKSSSDELEKSKFSPALLKIIALLQRDCQTAFNSAANSQHFLFRSSNSSLPDMFKGNSEKHKKIFNVSQEIQDTFDTILNLAGFKALLKNSILTLMHYDSESLPNRYLIFPMDGFHFTYYEKYARLSGFISHTTVNKFLMLNSEGVMSKVRSVGRLLKYLEQAITSHVIEHKTTKNKFFSEYKLPIDFLTELSEISENMYYRDIFPNEKDVAYLLTHIQSLPALDEWTSKDKHRVISFLSKGDPYTAPTTNPEAAALFLSDNQFFNTDFENIPLRRDVLINGSYYAFRCNRDDIGDKIIDFIKNGQYNA